MSAQGLIIYLKNAHTKQYVHCGTISCIRSLAIRAKRVCSVNLLPEEINEIKKFASRKSFPKSISTSIIKHALNKSINDYHTDDNNDMKFYLNLPYFGRAGEMLVKKCNRTLNKNIKEDVRVTFVVTYNTTILSSYTNTNDRIDKLIHSYSKSYIGKTERAFFERINENAFKDKNSVVCNHINNCDGVKYIDQIQTECDKFNKKIYSVRTVKENLSIIDRARRWDILLFKEALHIKQKNPTLNNGLKASKELKLF